MPAIRNPPAMQETWVWSPGQEDPLEEDMATHSSILAWRVPWTEEPSATVHRVTKSWTHMHAWLIQPVEIISVTIQWKGMITSKISLTPLETNVYLLFQTELKHFELVYGFFIFLPVGEIGLQSWPIMWSHTTFYVLNHSFRSKNYTDVPVSLGLASVWVYPLI